jgi:manganese/zinc/iron transport system permease protein
MSWAELINDLFFDYTLRTVAIGSMVLGIVSGALGAFAMLRKQSLLGDAISHAALPGVVLAFLLTRSKAPLILVVGAGISGWLATLWMINIAKHTRIKQDTSLGLVLSVFFGLGMVLLTYTQQLPDARQAGLSTFLFGQAAALLEKDVQTMAILGALVILFLLLFWKEFKILSFDRDYGVSIGFPMQMLDVLLTTLLVISIVIGLQAVGVILMSAMVVAPAAAARQWTDRLDIMVILSAIFGAISGLVGSMISSSTTGLSTGPTIVLSASTIVLISFLFAPNRGLIWNWFLKKRNRRQLRMDGVMNDLYQLYLQHGEHDPGHKVEVLQNMNAGRGGVAYTLQVLARQGWVRQQNELWTLTSKGLKYAREFLNGNGQENYD